MLKIDEICTALIFKTSVILIIAEFMIGLLGISCQTSNPSPDSDLFGDVFKTVVLDILSLLKVVSENAKPSL